jgi:integrase
MKKKLTIKTVSAIKPQDKYFDVWDTEISGFFLRVYPSGSHTYFLFYRNNKNQKRTYKIGKGLTAVQARDIASTKNADVAKGVDIHQVGKHAKIKAEKDKNTTLSAFLDNVYKQWLTDNRESGNDAYNRLIRSFPKLANKQLEQITSWDIVSWTKEQKKSGLSGHTIKRNLAELKALCVRAKEWGFIAANPLQDVKSGKLADNRVDRYLSDVERSGLYKALDNREAELRIKRNNGNKWREQRGYELFKDYSKTDYVDYLKPIILLALNTGLRKGEIFSLKWSNVNLSSRQITVTSQLSKSKKARYIPLNDQAHNALKQWHSQAHDNDLVFYGREGNQINNIRKSWTTLLKEAGITGFRFHDLRHDFASQLVMKGVDLYVVKELLGHSSIQVTERYAHLAPKQLEDAVNLLNA